MKNKTNSSYLTVRDVSEYLNISKSQAYELVHRKDFPVSRFGGAIRVPRELFLQWVQKQTYVPANLVA